MELLQLMNCLNLRNRHWGYEITIGIIDEKWWTKKISDWISSFNSKLRVGARRVLKMRLCLSKYCVLIALQNYRHKQFDFCIFFALLKRLSNSNSGLLCKDLQLRGINTRQLSWLLRQLAHTWLSYKIRIPSGNDFFTDDKLRWFGSTNRLNDSCK